jgi:hypothetical protein
VTPFPCLSYGKVIHALERAGFRVVRMPWESYPTEKGDRYRRPKADAPGLLADLAGRLGADSQPGGTRAPRVSRSSLKIGAPGFAGAISSESRAVGVPRRWPRRFSAAWPEAQRRGGRSSFPCHRKRASHPGAGSRRALRGADSCPTGSFAPISD